MSELNILFRRGTAAENDAYTGKEGEVTLDLDNKTLRIHDGVTQGGHTISAGSDFGDGLGGESLTGEEYEALVYLNLTSGGGMNGDDYRSNTTVVNVNANYATQLKFA